MMKNKIKKLIIASKKIFEDCSLENGAIVAANSDNISYPKDVQNYRYVWPRDASFICVASDILGIKNIQENFYQWLIERAEGFDKSGLLYQNYYPNGPKRWLAFQPDQNGTVLWSIYHHYNYKRDLDKAKEFKELIEKLADGICNVWNGKCFTLLTQDIWEERYTYPEIQNNHTYSLASCSYGLECANKIMKKENWGKVAEQMRKKINLSYNNYFLRTYGRLVDKTVDASMLGLVYPFEIYKPNDSKIINTVKAIEQRLVKNGGLQRYELDYYDSYRNYGINGKRGSGAWPLLNFWLSVYYCILGNRKKAEQYYNWVMKKIDKFIPEQIFQNNIQNSPIPLAWSHAMFIIASDFLGFI
jgi:GH15 family glucan-1,4-alpha-glucosidase